MACMASATEAKKIRPSPFDFGKGTIFNSADMVPASVPSLPARMSFRFPGWRKQRSSHTQASVQQTCGHALGDFGGMLTHKLGDQSALRRLRALHRPDGLDAAVGQNQLK